MLFLAVFAGSVAEYQLEHINERSHEREYMESMVKDLRSDTASIRQTLIYDIRKLKGLDSMINILSKSTIPATEIVHLHKLGWAILVNYPVSFSTGTLTQLKYSGSLRLVQSRVVLDSVMSYDSNIIQIDGQKKGFIEYAKEAIDKMSEIMDLRYIVANGKAPEPKVSPLFSSNALALANKAALIKGVVSSYDNMLKQQQQHAQLLIKLIDKVYELGGE
jgi:hypothetical protein